MGSTSDLEDGNRQRDSIVAQLLRATAFVPDVESGRPDNSASTVTNGPPCATSFVEAHASSSSVLEEWVMRGEHRNVDAFRTWREQSDEATSVR